MSQARKPGRAGLPLRVRCPVCHKLAVYEGNPWRPFCSERCKLIDLGRWAEGAYRLPSEDTPSSEPPPEDDER